MKELHVYGEELPLPTLRHLSDLRSVNPAGTLFPRLESLVWTLAQRSNDITNFDAFLGSRSLTDLRLEISYGIANWGWYKYYSNLAKYISSRCPNLLNVAFVPTDRSGPAVVLPVSALRAFGSLDWLAIHVLVKGKHTFPIHSRAAAEHLGLYYTDTR